MAVTCSARYSTKEFTYIPASKTFIVDVSDLWANHSGMIFDVVYDDACDEGLVLVSHVTGTEIVFAVNERRRDDGDLLYWELKPVGKDKDCGITVRIYND